MNKCILIVSSLFVLFLIQCKEPTSKISSTKEVSEKVEAVTEKDTGEKKASSEDKTKTNDPLINLGQKMVENYCTCVAQNDAATCTNRFEKRFQSLETKYGAADLEKIRTHFNEGKDCN